MAMESPPSLFSPFFFFFFSSFSFSSSFSSIFFIFLLFSSFSSLSFHFSFLSFFSFAGPGNCGPAQGPDYKTWIDALSFEVGAYELAYMKHLFTSLPWWTLAPNASAITWDEQAPSDETAPGQKTAPDGSIILAYLPVTHNASLPPQCGGSGGGYTGVVHLSPARAYSAQWFSPTTGSYTPISARIAGQATWTSPLQPNASIDWVLLVSDIGPASAAEQAAIAGEAQSWISNVQSTGRIRQEASLLGCNVSVGPHAITVTSLGRFFLPGEMDQKK
jgi:hypothetical protein